LSGKDPSEFNTADPIRLWIIQVGTFIPPALSAPMASCADFLAAHLLLSIGIIVCTASLLALVLRKIRQPKVIAEVLGGILLGACAFNYTSVTLLIYMHIFRSDRVR